MVPPLADIDLAHLIIEKGGLADRNAQVLFLLTSASSGCPAMTELALTHLDNLQNTSPSVPWVIAAAQAKMEREGTYWQELYARPEFERWVKCFDPPGVIRQLLHAGADAKATLPDGTTALHLVSDAASAQLLIDAGAKPDAANEAGRTPLHETRDAGVARVLLNAGVNVNARDKQKDTPLFGRYDALTVQTLLNAGADVNARNAFGWTALFSVDSGDAAHLLIEAGVQINARDNEGRTALEFMRDPETALILANAGARASTPTALAKVIQWAAANERQDLVDRLLRSAPLSPGPN
jgi:ankyrin repeat protein